ncbi:cupredoxin domain-containing protein [Natrinema soli]|uniref:Plastocyanin/azurin family copper-binding protein n=1 Tax=Natrinema soli TaxID=1930624 RepID=A0ABD5STZ0_9EURY|nr:plastocyanin/azurin family copper-binding protein [Natrinema soli]
MTNEQRSRDVSRRGVLKGTAALTGTAAMAGTAGAYRDEIDFRLPAAQNDGEGRTLSLLGIVGGWVGVAPAEIDGVSNPTLRLIEGEEHEVVWTNGDGSHHNFNLLDENGETIEATEFIEEQGESLSFTFTADSEMAEYNCAPHPVQMRGPIELVDAEEVHELRVQVEDEEGEPLGAEVFVGDMHSFSDIAARPDPPEDEQQSGQEPGGADGNETTGNETAGNETIGNETAGNETIGNETAGNETAGNETIGNETTGNETTGNETATDDVQAEEAPAAEDAPAVARFDMLEDGEYDVEIWTYGHERITDTVTIDGEDRAFTATLPATEPGEPAEIYSLALEEGQWVGQSPDSIADETNPTLELEAGETYAVEWENTIGRHQPEAENRTYESLPGHNFVIASAGDTNQWNTYVRSDFTAEEGATQTIEFVATEEMGVYLDQSQLEAVGEISVGGGGGETTAPEDATTGTNGNETATADDNETTAADGNETAAADGNETTAADGNETDGTNGY